MNFSQSLTYLNSFYDLEKTMTLPQGRRWKLERMRQLLKTFGQPQTSFLPVIIVGTKGKGSTGFFLQSILKEAGISAGFYSSPHLESPRERIRINGEIISKAVWAKILTQIKKKLGSKSTDSRPKGPVTYFEIMTLMAVLAFKAAGVKTAVFEAGMGGRLDAVNALGSPLVIVTPIHLDHQEFLGPTIARIAAEKAAVIHHGNDVIMAPQLKQAERVIRSRAARQKARLWPVTKKTGLPLGLPGEHQAWNAAAAVRASEVLQRFLNARKSGSLLKIPAKVVRAGLAAGDWPGRFETFKTRPGIILDGAHNPAAVTVLVKTLQSTRRTRKAGREVLLFGVTRDKDSQAMLKILARYFAAVVLTPLPSSRGKSTAELSTEARHCFPVQVSAGDVPQALGFGKELAGPQGTLVVTGSFYLAGAVRAELRRRGTIHE